MKPVATRFLRHISKSRFRKSIADNMIEIENVYGILTKPYLQPRPHGRLYHIVISNTKSTSARDLTFRLTHHFFNRVHRELRKTNFYLNYLFVLEYPKAVSLPMRRIESVDLHAHATINTNIPYLQLGKVLDNILNQRINYYIEDITDRADKENLVQYVTKQSRDNHFLTHDHFNYKIDHRTGSTVQ